MFPSFAFAQADTDTILKDFVMPNGYNEISQNIAYALLESRTDIVLIDVRTAEEFKDAHIEKALNIPLETLVEGATLAEVPDLNTPILLYCRSGRRATVAGQMLVNAGYKHVINFGGIVTWQYGTISGK